QNALKVWRSIRSTFYLFLIVVPFVLATNTAKVLGEGASWSELITSAGGMIAVAAVIAEILRHAINHLAGDKICRWRTSA
ncbi:MAG: hypothetical protein AB3N06_06015, partial [Erythrobacter sp.]